MLLRACLLACLTAAPLAVLPTARAADGTPTGLPDADTARAVAVMQDHVRVLHDRLRITAGQERQWTALADAMVDNARRVAALHAQGDAPGAPTNALADLRHYAAVAQVHAEDVQRLLAPFEELYGAMTPEQRAVADQTFRRFEQERVRKAGL